MRYLAENMWSSRYFRLKLDFANQTHAQSTRKEPSEALPSFSVDGQKEIHDRSPTVRYAPVGSCIYCGSQNCLSEEHIVGEGLAGSLVLPQASCPECATATCRIEGSVLRTLLLAPRRHLGIKVKKRKRNEPTIPLTAIVDGKDVEIRLPLDEYPTLLFMMIMNAPGIAAGRPLGAPGIHGAWARQIWTSGTMPPPNTPQFASPPFDSVRFCQMLAKIAHAFAAAEIGPSNFNPLLLDFILRPFSRLDQFPECYHLVGGSPVEFAASDALHVLGIEIADINGQPHVVVGIRLFANLAAPVYVVVVGNATSPEQCEALRAYEAAHAHKPDKTPA